MWELELLLWYRVGVAWSTAGQLVTILSIVSTVYTLSTCILGLSQFRRLIILVSNSTLLKSKTLKHIFLPGYAYMQI